MKYSEPVSNFLEFFNPFCASTFGELHKLYRHNVAEFLNVPITVRVLRKDVIDANDKQTLEFKRLNFNPLNYFEEVSMTFLSLQEVEQFTSSEHQIRFDFVNTLTNFNFSVKHFVLDKKTDNDLLAVNNTTKILYYRQNLMESILSNLVKSNYFDYPATAKVQHLGSKEPHNWNGRLTAFGPDSTIIIDETAIRNELIYTINLLKFYKANPSQFDKIYSFEDVFKNKSTELNANLTSMKRMPYTAKKERYFANSEIIPDVVKSVLQENNLQDVVEELGMII
jgi:hypothetical protein